MRRAEPAYPDLFPITHVVRPGYLPGPRVTLDPIRMSIVWEDAPHRILPTVGNVPRQPVNAIIFGRVACLRHAVVEQLQERGSSLLVVLDDPSLGPADLSLNGDSRASGVTALLPVLPSPLGDTNVVPEKWSGWSWGAVLGLFPFPGADVELEHKIKELKRAGASFVISAPLLLTPKDRHRILDACDDSDQAGRLENCLFHADVSRGLHALERQVGVTQYAQGLEPALVTQIPQGHHPMAVRTAALLRLWARRLDQSHEESSWGWRLRRAASALEHLPNDPQELAAEDNLRVVPGFDPWVESFTRALWHGGEPVDSAWRRWSGECRPPTGV